LLPVLAVLASMSSVQLGATVSVRLFDRFGVAGTTWLRLVVSAAVLLVAARPRGLRRADVAAAAGLGVVMAVNMTAFAGATARIPLGTTVAVEFCGPLGVAAFGARGRSGRSPAWSVWPVTALVGVLVITRPWRIGGSTAGAIWQGLGLAALAGAGWAIYIVLVAHVGRRTQGQRGLAVALATAAVALAPLGVVQAWPALLRVGTDAGVRTALGGAVLAALLVPLGAYALEMAALRRMDQAVFGVWMALEPAIGALAGLILLGQRLALAQLPGLALVVIAGIGAQRAGRRPAG
jgi:inner membrane transporter RhtA